MNHSDIVIQIEEASKVFRIYDNPQDRLKQYLLRGRRTYYKEFAALRNVSFHIFRGQSVGLIGRNGSGKSTLLQMIAGTLQPSAGRIHVNGRVAALLELGSGFNPEFTGQENIYLNGAILGIDKAEMDKRYDSIVKFADIGDFIGQPVKTYSSGMYVRLAFAVSINVDPDILIVDEALAVGDGRFQLKCFEKIKELKDKGTTILVVSHDLQSIRQICDHVVLLDRGQLIEFGDPNEVVNHYTKLLYDTPAAEIQPSNDSSFTGANSLDPWSAKEFRYGTHEGRIEQIVVNGLQSETIVCTTGDEFVLSFEAQSLRFIEQPIYAMTIKSAKGLEVYGTNTYFQNIPFRHLSKDEKVKVVFSQKISLMPGNYYVSLGFVELVDGDIKPIDRRYDVLELKVLPIQKDRSFGVANLHSVISLHYPIKSEIH